MQLRKYMPDFALYRDKESKEYAFHAQNFVQMCQSIPKIKPFLHRDYELAHSLNAVGVHLTSTQFDDIPKAKALGLEVIISTHTHDEVFIAEAMGAEYVTYSPIFEMPNKGEPKGVDDLKDLVRKTEIRVFALGGIVTQEQIEDIEPSGAYGFASIRYFLQ